MTTAALPARNWLMPLNAVLAVVCAVLFLLAIEQRQALEVWQAVRSAVVSMFERNGGWIDEGVARLASARPAPTAPDAVDVVLSGAFVSEGPETSVEVVFQHQDIRFDTGPTLHTRPWRITTAGETRVEGRTLAERFNTVPEAQIEWRQVEAATADEAEAAAGLCAGTAPERLAILHRADRVDLLLFAAGSASLDEMTAPCGDWRLRAR